MQHSTYKQQLNKCIVNYYTLFFFLVVVLSQTIFVCAAQAVEQLKINQLGGFEVKFAAVKPALFVKEQNLIGEVNHKPGDSFSVHFPFDVQRVHYLVNNGDTVNAGDVIATVEGIDVHHFIESYLLAKKLLSIAQVHFDNNKQHFKDKIIRSSEWVEITKSYYTAKLNVEHIEHQMSVIKIGNDEEVSLISPHKGIVKLIDQTKQHLQGDVAFNVINQDALRVKLLTALQSTASNTYFQVTPECQLVLDHREEIADKYHQVLWAKPDFDKCDLRLGERLTVTPMKKLNGYKINKSAVFEFNSKNLIAVKDNDSLKLFEIELISADKKNYFFTSQHAFTDQQVLISSVSILQGLLLGLGEE